MGKKAKYKDIENYFITNIENGSFPVNSMIIPEAEIIKLFNASHMTVNRAMKELVINKYITRIPGKGSFVSNSYKHGFSQNLSHLDSVSSLIANMGMVVTTDVIKLETIKAKEIPEIAKTLELNDNDYIHFFLRARYGDNNLVCLSYTYLVQSIIPTIDVNAIKTSFNKYIKSCNILRSFGSTEFCATLPTPEQAKIIGSAHVALLKQTLIWYSENKPFEVTYHYFIGDKYTVTQSLYIKNNPNYTE